MATKKKVVKKARHLKEKTLDQFSNSLSIGSSAKYRVKAKILDKIEKKKGKVPSKYSNDKKERKEREGLDKFIYHSTKALGIQAAAQAYNVSRSKMRKMRKKDK